MRFLHFPTAHLRDAQPDVPVPLRVREAELELLGSVGVDAEVLISKRRSSGRDLAEMVTVLVHVQRPGVLVPFVKGNTEPKNVLTILEVVRDVASLIVFRAVEDIPLA